MPEHTCHIPYCNVPVPPRMLMCKGHWRLVPRHLQEEVWATYQPGQERGEATPSGAWHKAADAAIKAVVEAEREKAKALYAVTLWRPWTDAIFRWPGSHAKRIENRSWFPSWAVGKRIAVHAGKRYEREGAAFINLRAAHVFPNGEWRAPPPEKSPQGIVGVATLCGVVDEQSDPQLVAGRYPQNFSWTEWFMGGIGWLLDDVVALPQPISCNGRQGLWRVHEPIATIVLESVEAIRNAG